MLIHCRGGAHRCTSRTRATTSIPSCSGSNLLFAGDPDRIGWKEASTFRAASVRRMTRFLGRSNTPSSRGQPNRSLVRLSRRHTSRCTRCARRSQQATRSVHAELASTRPGGMDERTARRRLRLQQWHGRRERSEGNANASSLDASSRIVASQGLRAPSAPAVVSRFDRTASSVARAPGQQDLARTI